MEGYIALISHKNKSAFLEAVSGTNHSSSFGNSVFINGVVYENVMMRRSVLHLRAAEPHENRYFRPERQRQRRRHRLRRRCEWHRRGDCHCDTPLAVSKLDSIKQFDTAENQFFDGTSIQARYLYDLFVPEKRLTSIGDIVEG